MVAAFLVYTRGTPAPCAPWQNRTEVPAPSSKETTQHDCGTLTAHTTAEESKPAHAWGAKTHHCPSVIIYTDLKHFRAFSGRSSPILMASYKGR